MLNNLSIDKFILPKKIMMGNECIEESMPLLGEYAARLAPDHFEDTRILYINHAISDAVLVARELGKRSGRVNILAIPYSSMDSDERQWVIKEYNKIGPTVVPEINEPWQFRIKMREAVIEILKDMGSNSSPLIIVEDGGYAFPVMHEKEFDHVMETVIGAVEHTARGMWNYQYNEIDATPKTPRKIKKPAITVARSRIKAAHEPPFVAQGIMHEFLAVLKRRHEFAQHKKVAVLGYGKVGKSLIELLEAYKMITDVIDPKSDNPDGRVVNKEFTQEHFDQSHFIFGASGSPAFRIETFFEFIENHKGNHKKCFVSASSKNLEFENVFLAFEQLMVDENLRGKLFKRKVLIRRERIAEYGTRYILLSAAGHSIGEYTILGDGYPIIFYPKNTHANPNRPFDPIMTQLFLSAAFLQEHHKKMVNRVYMIDELASEFNVNAQWEFLLDSRAMMARWCELNDINSKMYLSKIEL